MAAELHEKAKRGERERVAARALFGGAKEVVPDKQGRVAIPQALREYAELDRDVVHRRRSSRTSRSGMPPVGGSRRSRARPRSAPEKDSTTSCSSTNTAGLGPATSPLAGAVEGPYSARF